VLLLLLLLLNMNLLRKFCLNPPICIVVVAENPGTAFRELRLYSSCKGLSAKVEVVAQGNQ
jgi:hypothetical protein